MTDLHCHILPNFDDGAASFDIAVELLKRQIADGIDTVVLTPHFYIEREPLAEYLVRRQNAYEAFKEALAPLNLPVQLKLGAEVAFSPLLEDEDLTPLCIEDTNILLLELPTLHSPQWLKELLYSFQMDGIVPLIAHIERYSYLTKDTKAIEELINSGVYTQVNASTLLGDGKRRKEALKLIKHNLLHVVATDTHSLDRRPPKMKEALHVIQRKLGDERVQEMITASDAIAYNQDYQPLAPRAIRSIFGF